MLGASARERHGNLYEVGPVKRFKVSHTTLVKLPQGVEILRVYHGIPDPAAWAGPRFRAERAVLTPSGCQIKSENPQGAAWMWEFPTPAFTEQTFESRYDLASADRRFKAEHVRLQWDDFLPPDRDRNPAPVGVVALAEEVHKATPLESIAALCYWIRHFSGYDASVSHEASDVAQTLLVGRGQCGHHANLFAAVMKVWGIPCRIVSGIRLKSTSELWTDQNDWNRHAWVEVLLPEVGWVEVEPRASNDPYFQPAELIRNSGVQSHASWIYKEGKWSILETYQDRIVGK
jgi:transglutaminase-like putative cysteine protease